MTPNGPGIPLSASGNTPLSGALGMPGGPLDFGRNTPQAVFTSFKLPKPGQQQGNVLSAPLGGLPAMATQLAMAAAGKMKTEDAVNESLSPPPAKVSKSAEIPVPATPPKAPNSNDDHDNNPR